MKNRLENLTKTDEILLEKKKGLEKVRYVPSATFYPDDKVFFLDRPKDTYVIEWAESNENCKGGYLYGTFSPETKAHCYTSEDRIKLIQRGNVWRYNHGKELEFKDTQEEAEFYEMLKHYKEIEHPLRTNTCQSFLWYKDEALEAIKVGLADCLMLDRFQKPYVIKFYDREVGERIRKGIIKNFKLEDTPLRPGLLEHVPVSESDKKEIARMLKESETISTKQFLKEVFSERISNLKAYFIGKRTK